MPCAWGAYSERHLRVYDGESSLDLHELLSDIRRGIGTFNAKEEITPEEQASPIIIIYVVTCTYRCVI